MIEARCDVFVTSFEDIATASTLRNVLNMHGDNPSTPEFGSSKQTRLVPRHTGAGP
jgi:hypothetical protein